jgi:heterodisulfide reductase subunit A
MTDVGRHPRIKLLTLSEVVDVKGYVGNFDIKIIKRAKFVDESACTSCGECAKVCPVVRPDEFNAGLASRRAIYSPFPQAVPSSYLINIKECLGPQPRRLLQCVEVCDKKCINFHMSDEEIVERVGTIIVATGL